MAKSASYMLDTNVFNDVLEENVSLDEFAGLTMIVTGVQGSEIRATKCEERRNRLLVVFMTLPSQKLPTASFAFDIEGAGLDESFFNSGDGQFDKMLSRLREKDKGRRKGENQVRDILILETALKENATLVTGDLNLAAVMREFGGKVTSLRALRQEWTRSG